MENIYKQGNTGQAKLWEITSTAARGTSELCGTYTNFSREKLSYRLLQTKSNWLVPRKQLTSSIYTVHEFKMNCPAIGFYKIRRAQDI